MKEFSWDCQPVPACSTVAGISGSCNRLNDVWSKIAYVKESCFVLSLDDRNGYRLLGSLYPTINQLFLLLVQDTLRSHYMQNIPIKQIGDVYGNDWLGLLTPRLLLLWLVFTTMLPFSINSSNSNLFWLA